MAFYDSADALFGTGTYGSARYGRVTPVVQITGVSATANTRTIHLNVFEVDISEPIYNAQGATGSVGSLTLNTAAGLSGVAGTSAVGTLSPNVDEPIGSVSAIGSVNTVTVNVQESVTGLVATATLDTTGLVVKSINTISVSGFELDGLVGTIEPQTLEALQSVESIVYIGNIKANLVEKITSVSATGSIDSLGHSNTTTLTGAVGTGQVGNVGGAPTEKVSGLESTANVNSEGVKVNITEIIPSSPLPFIEGNDLGATIRVTFVPQTAGEVATANAAPQGEATRLKIVAETFDFDAVATQYSRRRTVTVSRAA